MTYETFIAKLRLELKDTDKIARDKWDGDGSTTLFMTNYKPIKDASYTVKIGGVEKTENTDYTIDKDLGLLTFTSAPASGSDNVEMTYRYQKLRDADYLEIINDGIDHFRWKFWKETEDTTTITTTKDQYNYDLSGLTDILYLIQVWYKTSSSATYWTAVSGLTNWKYLIRQKKLYVDPPFSSSSLPMKFRYLQSFTKGTTTSATLDIPDEWLLPYKYYVYARYYERLIPEKIHETAAITTQPSFAPAQLAYDISQKYYSLAEIVANKLAPKLPPMPIRQIHEGISL